MKKETQNFALTLCMIFLCTAAAGCTGIEILNEIPQDFALIRESKISERTSGDAAGIVSGEISRELSLETVEEASAKALGGTCVSFLMKEAGTFACGSLSETEQIWYHDMERILGSFGEDVELSPKGLEGGIEEGDIDKIFQCVMCDHPEIFYVDGYSYTKYVRGEEIISVKFSGNYSMSLDEALERRKEIENAVEGVLSGIGKEASDYDKVKYVYETLIRNTNYDLNVSDNQNIYSVFVHHLSVCQGYAKATQYLLNRLGIECALVQGMVETGEGHAWNLVKVDGSYYYVDTTWGDVSYRMEETGTDGGALREGMPEINYDYLNVTTEEILRTHTIKGVVPMPQCTETEANYYRKEGALFEDYDPERLGALFQKAADMGQRDVTVKCADADCYEEIRRALIEEQGIFDYLKDTSVAYAQNEKQFSLTFWVTNE